MRKLCVLALLAALLFSGCQLFGGAKPTDIADADANPSGTGEAPVAAGDGFVFCADNVEIVLGAEAGPIIEALGPYLKMFEEPSCAFDGIDRTYYYNGFYVTTFPYNGVDYVNTVNLMDDSVLTGEGCYLGMGLDDALLVYGDGYTREQEMYRYTKNNTELAVLADGGVVVQITYFYKGN